MIGLIHLLTIALRVLTLKVALRGRAARSRGWAIEFSVRRQLQIKRKSLTGIYAGQKGRRTTRPSAELLLKAFQDIDAVIGNVNAESIAYLSPLTSTQQQILSLLGLDPHIYDDSLPRFQFRKSPKK